MDKSSRKMTVIVWMVVLVLMHMHVQVTIGGCTCQPENKIDCSSVDSMADLEKAVNSTDVALISCIFTDPEVRVLAGDLPTSFGGLKRLTWLHMEGVALASIPTDIGLLTNLGFLWLPSNEIKGKIPTEIGLLTKLTSLNLNDNYLTGSIPTEIGKLNDLSSIEMWRNELTGSIPSTLTSCPKLEHVWLNENKLQGKIPEAFGSMRSLTNFVVADNKLTGTVPAFQGQLKTLYVRSPGTCGISPQHSAKYTDLPSPNDQIEDCSKFTPEPTKEPVATPKPNVTPGTRSPSRTTPTRFPTALPGGGKSGSGPSHGARNLPNNIVFVGIVTFLCYAL